MMNEYQQQMMPNMMQMNYQQFNPPQMPYDPYGNQMMMPQMMRMDPQPVPPPGTVDFPPHQYVSPEPVPMPVPAPQQHQQFPQNNGYNAAKKQSDIAMKKVRRLEFKYFYLNS